MKAYEEKLRNIEYLQLPLTTEAHREIQRKSSEAVSAM